MGPGVICFGEFELDTANCELRRSGRVIKLERQPMDLLILLAENAGRLVRREEIVGYLWGSNTILGSDQNINSSIRKIRSALRDDADHPKIVATVTGKGYRFVAPLKTEALSDLAQPVLNNNQAVTGPVVSDRRYTPTLTERRKSFAPLLIGSAAVLVASYAGVRFFYEGGHFGGQEIRSIAVLPLSNLSADKEQEYFSEGMTDAIITDLARATDLRVVSHSTMKAYEHSKKL